MKVFGIVAEYNPFHNGHKYQVDFIKNELGADAIIVAMSGNFVQRGEPAILDKYARAKMAVDNGVDLVLEMPIVASTASAETFARCGIALLLSTGVISDIAFGCEYGNADIFYQIATILNEESPAFRATLQDALKNGTSFSEARAQALCGLISEDIADFISKPNNILGIEYTRALLHFGSDVAIHPIKRLGVNHDAVPIQDSYASASYLRSQLKKNTLAPIRPHTPANVFSALCESAGDNLLIFPNDISLLLHERLISTEDYIDVADCSAELSNRIRNLRDDYVDALQFSELLHTKNLELSRIRRILLHLLLNITKGHTNALRDCGYVPYLHILKFSRTGTMLLKSIKMNNPSMDENADILPRPLFSSINEIRHLYDDTKNKSDGSDGSMPINVAQKKLLRRDLYAADLYRTLQTSTSRQPLPTEFTRRFS